MVNKVLLIRPNHDKATQYLFCWAEEIVKLADSKNIPLSDLKGSKANRKSVCSYLTKIEPKIVLFNGHGSAEEITGHKNQAIIKLGENEELIGNKIVYAVSCHAAKKLGKQAVKNGNGAFIGYEGPFGFVHSSSRECTPHKDKIAVPFKEASNIVSLSLLKGRSVKEAYEKSQDTFNKLLKEYSTSDAFPENKDVRFWLFWDKYFQTFHGEPNACLCTK